MCKLAVVMALSMYGIPYSIVRATKRLKWCIVMGHGWNMAQIHLFDDLGLVSTEAHPKKLLATSTMPQRPIPPQGPWVPTINMLNENEGFHKWGYTQIIHFNGMFHYKPSIWAIYGNPPKWCSLRLPVVKILNCRCTRTLIPLSYQAGAPT